MADKFDSDEVVIDVEELEQANKKGAKRGREFNKSFVNILSLKNLPCVTAILSIVFTLIALFFGYCGGMAAVRVFYCLAILASLGSVGLIITNTITEGEFKPDWKYLLVGFSIALILL